MFCPLLMKDMCVCVTSCCYGSNEVRDCKEKKLMYKFRSLKPHGIDVM